MAKLRAKRYKFFPLSNSQLIAHSSQLSFPQKKAQFSPRVLCLFALLFKFTVPVPHGQGHGLWVPVR